MTYIIAGRCYNVIKCNNGPGFIQERGHHDDVVTNTSGDTAAAN